MGRPSMFALDNPNPKISWNLSRGVLRTSAQKLVRPVRLVIPCVFSPRASHVVTTPATVTAPIATMAADDAKNFRTRVLLMNMLRPATRSPTTKAASAVLVRVRRRIATPKMIPARVARPLIMRANQSTTVSPTATAANWAICVGTIGQITPVSLPSYEKA
jgi:hypothetical protein